MVAERQPNGFSSRRLRRLPAAIDRADARARLGLSEDDVLVCSFGTLDPTRLNHRLLAAWLASSLATEAQCYLALVGKNQTGEYGADLLRTIENSPAGAHIRITGFADPETYRTYLAAADMAVQLSTFSHAEPSRPVLDCLAYGLPTIVTLHGSLPKLPDDVVVKLPDTFEDADLAAVLAALRLDPEGRRTVAQRAAIYSRAHHHPRRIAAQYSAAIERFAHVGRRPRLRRLAAAIVDLNTPASPTEGDWNALATSIAINQRRVSGLRQFLVDVSVTAVRDHKTGIQRVVRSLVGQLIAHPPPGFRIEPVYGTAEGVYRYARRFTTALLGLAAPTFEDEPIEYYPGDIFLGLDCVPHIVQLNMALFERFRSVGINVYFVVYDLLPVQMPARFPKGLHDLFRVWFDSISNIAAGGICISRAVAGELAEWLEARRPAPARPFKIGYFHLGADIAASFPTGGLEEGFEEHLGALSARPTFLMVGTVEPRKGYAQAVASFEQLWAQDIELNLVIFGKQGWAVESLLEYLRNHPERGKRLFWFNGGSDEMLLHLYKHATSLLMASEAEGFGLPLIEAAQHRLPIIARDLPVFREVAGEHAFYFSGLAPDELAAAVRTWLVLWERAAAPKSDGMPWLTWEQSTAQLLDVILNEHWYTQWGSSLARMLKPQPPCVGATELSDDPETPIPTGDLQLAERFGGKMGIG